ncbi:MAG: hypothetical protein ACRCT8_12585 [Lacipirellulaceae bacterium]
MTTIDTVLLALATLVAVRTLVSLMRSRRDRVVAEVREQIRDHKAQAKSKKTAA